MKVDIMGFAPTFKRMWLIFWKEINTPSDFKDDPYGELTNQCAHTFLGLVICMGISVGNLALLGEFPQKELAAIIVTLPYILGEVFEQRWRGWDTIADVFFYAIGAYGLLGALSEVQIEGQVLLSVSWFPFVFSIAAFSLVMVLRLTPRVRRKYGTNS